jgi:hypothetical protein
MADIQFPTSLGPGVFTLMVRDNNGNPSQVLEAAAPFSIDTWWSIDAAAARVLGGQWEVAAYVESIGPGQEKQVGSTRTVPLTGGTNYSTTITVPANTLVDDPASGQSGAYKLVAVLTHRNFNKLSDVAALAEGPIVRIG